MSIKTFIDRPILSVMLSVVIVIIGIIGLLCLPLEQYPDIAPPTVKVNATYVGANAETVMVFANHFISITCTLKGRKVIT